MTRKAQATLEFLFMFLAAVVFISILLGGMVVAKDRAEEQADVVAHTVRMEGIARTLEEHSNCGVIMIFDISNETYRIEGSQVKKDYGNKTIVVEGIFGNATNHIEPV